MESHTFFTELLQFDLNLQFFGEAGRSAKIAARRNARPTYFALAIAQEDIQPVLAQERMFCRFHEPEKPGEVHDACHVGIVKLDTAAEGKWGGHERISRQCRASEP